MTFYWFTKMLDRPAFFVSINTFLKRNKRRFKGQFALYSLIIGLHLFLLSANANGMTYRAEYPSHPRFHPHPQCLWTILVFIPLTLGFGLPKLCYGFELLPIFATVASTSALFSYRGLV